MEHDQLLRSPFALRILNPHADLYPSLTLTTRNNQKAKGLGSKRNYCTGGGRKICKAGGLARLFSLEARALLVAVSLVCAVAHKLGPFQASLNGPSNM